MMSNFFKNIINHKFSLATALFILLVQLLPITEAKATHIVGGNLTYKHLGGNDYQVRLVLRRDCFLGSPEAEFDNPASIGIFTAGGVPVSWLYPNGQILLPLMSSDTLNEFIRSDCGFEGTQVCVHETTYLGRLTLPVRAGGYILAYQRCCRNSSLNNIREPLETGSTYFVEMREAAMRSNNSTPIFNQWPDVYICANRPLVFDHSATDTDGDSLVYKLCVPSSGATRVDPKPQPPGFPPYAQVSWAAPYSLNDMMGGSPLKIDPRTGVITATPNLVGQFLIGICVEEYRNGVLMSTVRRDFQYNVRVCSQPPKAQFSTSESNCDGLTVAFFNNSLASSDYVWDFNYPSGDPAFRSTARDPLFTYPRSGEYTVRLRATRGTDGCFDTLLQRVAVFENQIVPDFTYAVTSCDADNQQLGLTLSDLSVFDEPGYQIIGREWTVTQNGIVTSLTGDKPMAILSYSGDVTIRMVVRANNKCSGTVTKIIKIDDLLPKVDFEYRLKNCPSGDNAIFVFTNTSGPLNPFAVVDQSAWTILGNNYLGNEVEVEIPTSIAIITAKLNVSFFGTCEVELQKSFPTSTFLPSLDYKFEATRCPDDGNVNLTISYIDSLANGLNIDSLQWVVGTSTNPQSLSGVTINITIPKDSLINIAMNATFDNGCIANLNDSFIPGPFATIVFDADTIILCPNQTRTFVKNPNPNWTYTWTPTTGLDLTDPSNPSVTVTENTIYSVVVSDGLCLVEGSVQVIALTGGIDLSIVGDTISCDGNINLSAFGGVGAGVYTWATNPNINNPIATGENIKTSFPGNEQSYYVTFVGVSCSTEPAKITIRNQKPSIEDLSPFKICKLDTLKIFLINEITNHTNSYAWSPDPRIISGANSISPTIGIGPNESGDFFLYYSATNQFGCTLNDSMRFLLSTNPVVDFDYTLDQCGQTKICFKLSGGSFNGFGIWNFGDLTTDDDRSLEKDPCYTYPTDGKFVVSIINSVEACPFAPVSKEVIVNPQFTIEEIVDQVVCLGDTVVLLASANLTDINYTWKDVSGTLLSSTSLYTTTVSTEKILILEGTDIYGCKDVDTINVRPFVFDYQVTAPTDSLCNNKPTTLKLNITNPLLYSYKWSPAECIISGGNTDAPTVMPVEGKTLKVDIVYLPLGCISSRDFAPKVTKPFDFTLDANSVFCFNQPSMIDLQIDDPSAYTYVWTPAGLFTSPTDIQNPTIVIDEDQNITVVVTNRISGCKEEKTFVAKAGVDTNVEVDAQPDFIIFEGEALDLFIANVKPGETYLWSTGQTTTTITVNPAATTDYTVTVSDINGCTALDNVTVTVRVAKCDESDVFIPNAFSPNGDGANEVLYVRSNFVEELDFIIFNRWGQQIFKTSDPTEGWDGTFKGEKLPPDAYAYYIRALCINGIEYKKKGNVSLLK